MTLYEIVKALQEASGSNAKQAILEQHKENELLKAYLKATYDPSISYYQTKVNKSSANEGFTFNEDIIDTLIHYLANRAVTGNTAKAWLEDYVSMFSLQAQELIELLIKRSIGAGVGDTMILKVFPDLYFIPPYQRCSLMDDKIKAKFENLEIFIVQEKLDGSFCYLVKEAGKAPEAITRSGSKYPIEFAEKLAVGVPDDSVVIGELLVYGEAGTLCILLDRKTGNGILNSILQGGEVGSNIGFELVAWDYLTVSEFEAGKSNIPYEKRLNALDWFWGSIAETKFVKSLGEAYSIYSNYTSKGKEGVIIKSKDFKWSSGTSKDCVKLKIEFECDLKVIGMTEGINKYKGMMGSLTVSSSDGKIVSDVGTGFSDDARKAWWNQYTSEDISSYDIVVTVRANDIITRKGSSTFSLFLPVFLEERLDKSEADSYERCVEQLEAAKMEEHYEQHHTRISARNP